MYRQIPPQEPIIKLEDLSKRFDVVSEAPRSVLELLVSRFSVSRRQAPAKEKRASLWVVKDINLDVLPGECLGILGQNGSGKSTLLKLITRIVRPTSGRISVNGQVSALLELGAGFHTDLTGRENIYLNGSLLGLNKQNIEAEFDSIVAFSELAEFIDMPVKFYSSGMYMRLAFSIAVHVRPQVLIIDEILAVGDQSFQEKCINHIYDMKRRGVTIILVSHSLDLMRKLCTRLVWMQNGTIRASGPPEMLIQQYLVYIHERSGQPLNRSEKTIDRLGSGEIEITGVRLLDGRQQEQTNFLTGEPLTIEIGFTAHKPVREPEFGLAIYRQDGVQINGPNTRFAGVHMDRVEGKGIVCYHIKRLPLLPATYLLSVAVHDSRYTLTYDHHVKAYEFQVGSGGTREIYGLLEIPATWSWMLTSEVRV
jgi:lipopolysaccharide transport system ATP-binding protein